MTRQYIKIIVIVVYLLTFYICSRFSQKTYCFIVHRKWLFCFLKKQMSYASTSTLLFFRYQLSLSFLLIKPEAATERCSLKIA